MNEMRAVRIDKVTLNFGAGKDQSRMEKGEKLIQMITGKEPVKTYTDKRIPAWGLRPGLPVGLKLTLRGDEAEQVLERLLEARENKLPHSCVDDYGNVSFGVPEYIDIPDVKYDPDIGILGLQVSITLARPGRRVARRKNRKRSVGKDHRVDREAAEGFLQERFGTEFGQ